MTDAYVGIDVACAKGKRLPLVVGTWLGTQFSPLPLRDIEAEPPRTAGNVRATDPQWRREFSDAVLAYLTEVETEFRVTIKRVALDAPYAVRASAADDRASEAALGRAGISYFKTPTQAVFDEAVAGVRAHLAAGGTQSSLPNANRLWMLVGFSLYQALTREWECIEVYPQATVKALESIGVLPPNSPHKTHAKSALDQLRANSLFSCWPPKVAPSALRRIAFAPIHDTVDAYLAAFTAALEPPRRTSYGTQPRDAIWIPNYAFLRNYDRGDGRPAFDQVPLAPEELLLPDSSYEGEGERRRRSR